MTHMYFSARTEGRISYGHLGRTNSCYYYYYYYCYVITNMASPLLSSLVLILKYKDGIFISRDILKMFKQSVLPSPSSLPRDSVTLYAVFSVVVSVCLSVCHVRIIVSRRLKISSTFFLGPIAPSF